MTGDVKREAAPARRCRGRAPAVCWAVALAWLAAAAPARAAAKPVEVENLWIGFGSSGNAFKVGTWTPVWVQLRGGDARFEGFLEVVVADDDGTPSSYITRVDVGPRAIATVTAYVRPGARDPDLTLRLYDRDRNTVAVVSQDVVLRVPPTVLMPQETLILAMGHPQGVETIPTLPGFREGGKAPTYGSSGLDQVVVTRLDPRVGRLPGRWYGYDAARTIVVDTSDPEVLRSLEGMRGQPLVDWVRRGGHLVISVGANWQAVKDSVLGPILPGVPVGLEQVGSLEALDAFAGSNKQITPPGSPKALVTKLGEVERRGGTALSSVMSGLPLVVRGPCGFGRVTLIALDVDQKLFAEWPDRGLFWIQAADLRPQRAEQAIAMLPGPGRLNRTGVSSLAGLLRVSLEQFPGVRLIPFGWVAFFIFLYILLIGPGDYFFLKKVLKRMELTWITFPAIVIGVSLVAYYAAYVFKGNNLLVNQIDLIDVDQTAGLQRGMTWAGLFSPQNRDYNMRVLPLPLDREPAAAGSSPGGDSALPPGTEVIMTWFSSPENQWGAMGNSGRRFSFGNQGYTYSSFADPGSEPASGAVESLRGVRIPIWSTKNVAARWFGPATPLVDAELQPVGTDRLAGSVTNRLDLPLEDTIVAFNNQVYLVGTIGPHATAKVLSNDRHLSGYLREKGRIYTSQEIVDPNYRVNRYDLLLDAMFHDSASRLATDRSLSNDTLHDLDLTGQLVLPRPMLVARVKRPGARLLLENAPSPAHVDQTTLIRVILPLETRESGNTSR